MTDAEVRKRARKALAAGTEVAQIEGDARIIRLDDPAATGYAVEAWVYLMDEEELPAAYPHPSRVTASGPGHVTGLLPKCPLCPLAEGHDGDHLEEEGR